MQAMESLMFNKTIAPTPWFTAGAVVTSLTLVAACGEMPDEFEQSEASATAAAAGGGSGGGGWTQPPKPAWAAMSSLGLRCRVKEGNSDDLRVNGHGGVTNRDANNELTVLCPLNLSQALFPVSQVAYVTLFVRDQHSTRQVYGRFCVKEPGSIFGSNSGPNHGPSGAGEGECGTLKNSLNTNPGALDYQTIKLYPPRTTFSEAAIPYLRVSLPRSEAPAGQATRYSEVRAYVVYAQP